MGKNFRLAVAFASYTLAGTVAACPVVTQQATLTLSSVPLVLQGTALAVPVTGQDATLIGPIQISGTTWTPRVDGSNNILSGEWAQLPLNTTLYVATNKLDDVIPTPRYGTKGGSTDGSASIVRAWCGAAVDHLNCRMYISGGGHADSHICENGIYKLDSATMRFSVLASRSPLPGRYWTGAAWANLSGPTDVENESAWEPQLNASGNAQVSASHTFWQLDFLTPTAMGNTSGGFLNHFYTKVVFNLDTLTWDVPHWNNVQENVDFSYSVVLTDGLKAMQPYGDYFIRAWDYGQRETTSWSAEVGGATSLGKILYPASTATAGGFSHGDRIIRNQKAILRMPERREIVVLGVESEGTAQQYHRRLRIGEAVDATGSYSAATDWTSYWDTITLTSSDGSHTDFATQANWTDIGFPSSPSHLFAAGCVWDDDTGTAWVWGNTTTSDLYKLTGLASGNTVTTERIASTARPLTTSYNGTFGRCMLLKAGGATCIVRVNSTTEYAQIVRVA